jgi:cell division protein FtsZ
MAGTCSLQRDFISMSMRPEPRMLAIGVGGAGNDLLTHLMDNDSDGVFCIAADTDRYHLQIARAHSKFLMESELSSDSGTEGNVDVGRDAALQASESLRHTFEGADLVFILAGMGGGTGGGAAPVMSDLARRSGSLVIGLVTMPSHFESNTFRTGIESTRRMLNTCDTVILAGNQPSALSFTLPFGLHLDGAGQACCSIVSSITHTLRNSSLLKNDSRALRALLRRGGLAEVRVGDSYSPWGPEEAILAVLRNTIPHGHMSEVRGIFIDIIGGESVTDAAIGAALDLLTHHFGAQAELLCGRRIDESLQGTMRVHLLATGVGFPYSWSGYRRVPIDIYDLEPESGDDESVDLALDLQQLEDHSISEPVA